MRAYEALHPEEPPLLRGGIPLSGSQAGRPVRTDSALLDAFSALQIAAGRKIARPGLDVAGQEDAGDEAYSAELDDLTDGSIEDALPWELDGALDWARPVAPAPNARPVSGGAAASMANPDFSQTPRAQRSRAIEAEDVATEAVSPARSVAEAALPIRSATPAPLQPVRVVPDRPASSVQRNQAGPAALGPDWMAEPDSHESAAQDPLQHRHDDHSPRRAPAPVASEQDVERSQRASLPAATVAGQSTTSMQSGPVAVTGAPAAGEDTASRWDVSRPHDRDDRAKSARPPDRMSSSLRSHPSGQRPRHTATSAQEGPTVAKRAVESGRNANALSSTSIERARRTEGSVARTDAAPAAFRGQDVERAERRPEIARRGGKLRASTRPHRQSDVGRRYDRFKSAPADARVPGALIPTTHDRKQIAALEADRGVQGWTSQPPAIHPAEFASRSNKAHDLAHRSGTGRKVHIQTLHITINRPPAPTAAPSVSEADRSPQPAAPRAQRLFNPWVSQPHFLE